MTSKIRVLYVEDDPDWQEIIQDGSASLNYHIDFASTSHEAVEKLKRSTYHIALLDKRLNENDPEDDQGLAIATLIAGLDEGTKIIVYTAHGDIDDAREAFRKIKVWDFIGKNKPIADIIDALKKAGEEAVLEFRLPSKLSADILNIPDDLLDQFFSKFPSKVDATNAQSLERFAKRLLGEFRPLLRDRSDAKIVTVARTSILQVRYWSKMLGMPIAGWFGPYSEMKTAVEQADSDQSLQQSLGIGQEVNEVFDSNTFPSYGGVVFELSHAELDEFAAQLNINS